MGNFDSVVRVFIGMIILFAGLWYNSLWGFIGIILIATGALAFCPIYRKFNIQTCEVNLEREN